MTNDIPPADQPKESNSAPRKWYQSCGAQIMITGCAAPVLLILFTVISYFTTCGGNGSESSCGAAAVGFVIPVVFIFVTIPLLVIGGIVLGVSKPKNTIQVEGNSVSQDSPVADTSQKVTEALPIQVEGDSDNQNSPIADTSQKVTEPFPTFSVLSSLLSFWPLYIYRISIDPEFFVYLQFLGPVLAIMFAIVAWRKNERFKVLAIILAGLVAVPYLLLPLLTMFLFQSL